MIRRRAPRLPADLAAHLPHGTRTLAVAELLDGSWAVTAQDALTVLGADGVRTRASWDEVESARWDGETRQLTVFWVEGARGPLVLTTADDGVERFTSTLRERVQSSVVHSETTELPSGALVTANVRRGPGGELLSQVTARGPLAGDRAEQDVIDELERRVRDAVGLPT
ncbi:hypothetical protein MF406_10975 [Georgenia sp. TF02-10]|uniref:hypothetical protein n=1 Tax=Georgenia sp. TF02-10 TaxID=2917725 RepID=UPI001FA7532F|nr:hypothetical protein [Georgenia sp. TF02-10]UNX53517.1 hypothetical protein MF406_10975 [Georgenia sp. TF02-10]